MAAARHHVSIRCYAELNDFLPPERRQVRFDYPLLARTSVKDLIEAIGVPHPEVDLILVDGAAVDFARLVEGGEHISVYPFFTRVDLAPLIRLRPPPLPEPRFVLDTHLGKLAAYLRLLGFDALYRNDYDDETLADLAAAGPRILLSQDRGLLKRRQVTHGYSVRAAEPRQQLHEVARRFDLAAAMRPFSRCLRCNGCLTPVAKEAIADRLPPRTRRYYDAFYQCVDCERIYWPGSHYAHMQQLIAGVGDA